MALEEGEKLLTLKSVLKAEKYYFAFTYQALGALESIKIGQSLLKRDAQDGKTEAQISIRAESLNFNEKEQKYKRKSRRHLISCYKGLRSRGCVVLSVGLKISKRNHTGFFLGRPCTLPCICAATAQILVMPAMCCTFNVVSVWHLYSKYPLPRLPGGSPPNWGAMGNSNPQRSHSPACLPHKPLCADTPLLDKLPVLHSQLISWTRAKEWQRPGVVMPSESAGLKGHTKVNILVTLRSSTADGGSPVDCCGAQEDRNLFVNQQDQPQLCFPSQGHGLPGY